MTSIVPYRYKAFIDEAGDDGFRFYADNRGSSRWLVLSAVITDTNSEHLMLRLVRDIRDTLQHQPGRPLHFTKMRRHRALVVCKRIGRSHLRTISVLIHKVALNPSRFTAKQRLYHWASRLLLERVSWYCEDFPAQVVFSNRASMAYEEMRNYFKLLKNQETAIKWGSLDPEDIRSLPHERLAGLQLADFAASGLHRAVETNQFGETDDSYARALAPTFYRKGKNYLSYGLKFWPLGKAEIMADASRFGWVQDLIN